MRSVQESIEQLERDRKAAKDSVVSVEPFIDDMCRVMC